MASFGRKYIDRHKFLIASFVATAILCLNHAWRLKDNNLIYAVEIFNFVDASLFQNNPAIITGEITPRIFTNCLFYIGMKWMGFRWESVLAFFVALGIVVLAIGCVNCVKNLIGYPDLLSCACGALFLGISATGSLPGFPMLEACSVGLGTGFAFSVLAISFVVGERKDWKSAWLWLSVSVLFHVHEGIYGFLSIALIWIVTSIKNHEFMIQDLKFGMVFILALCIPVLPTMLTDQSQISDVDFVNIYAIRRTPHHLVPSRWKMDYVIKNFFLMLYPLLFYFQYYFDTNIKEYFKKHQWHIYTAAILIGLWWGVIGLSHLFTEIYPSSFMVSLNITKALRYIDLFPLFIYVLMIQKYISIERYILAIGIFLFAIIAVRYNVYDSAYYFTWNIILIHFLLHLKSKKWFPIPCIIFLFLYETFPFQRLSIYAEIVLGAVASIIFLYTEHKKILSASCILAFIALLSSCYGRIYCIDHASLQLMNASGWLEYSAHSEVYDMGNLFKKSTKPNEIYFANFGSSSATYFQIIAQRSCYVLWKTVPSSKGSIVAWWDRVKKVQSLKMNPVKVHDFMKNEKIDWLFLDDAKYYNAFDSALGNNKKPLYKLWKKSKTDKCRVYKLN